MKTRTLPLAISAVSLILSVQAKASLVYDNGPIGASDYSAAFIDSVSAGGPYAVSDSFTVSSATSLSSAQAGLWVDAGATPVSLDWSVGTTPFASDISSGTASLNDTFVRNNGFDIYESAFAVNGTLGIGTYYFTLQNGVASDSGSVSWDNNNGPSTAYQSSSAGSGQLADGTSESFQLYGVAVPEPTTTTIFAGFAALGMLLATSRRKFSMAG
jgi:hypothetical protein